MKNMLKEYALKMVKSLPARFALSVSWNSTEGYMLGYAKEVLRALENDRGVTTRQDAITGLRQLSLDEFGLVLLSMPDPEYPKLSRLLPAMASDEVQRSWTGNYGLALLKETTAFVRALSYNYARVTGRSLDDATVLDFGCGYGRIAQLLYYFTVEEKIFGVDPRERSIELCRESGLSTNFAVSDYLPASLPVGPAKFDLIYAFSVFTHLSRRAMATSLHTLRQYIADDGLLAMTIRPVEYWKHAPHTSTEEKDVLSVRHRKEGFAFNPHNWAPIDGDVTYGDSSMSLDWIAVTFPDWTIKATDRCLNDALQRYVFLVPS
ncbi:MAG TPA: class I SAM-dependent methyltransferase [Nitrospirales bacterium]|nr:class I SAM-dependent methyltransferase [Nitrospirales bacterium]